MRRNSPRVSDRLSRHVGEATLVAFDIETTGLNPVADGIVEIAAVKRRAGREIAHFHSLVDPQRPISPGAAAIHGISDEQVRGQPTIEEVLPQFLEFAAGNIALAHNAAFDLGFLWYEISKGFQAPDVPVLDTCALARKHLRLGRHSLDALVRHLNLASGQEHRALADARHCAEVFLACARRVEPSLRIPIARLLWPDSSLPNLADAHPASLSGEWVLLRKALEAGAAVEILYTDSAGRKSVRVIRPQSIGFYGGSLYVEAHCLLAGRRRTFVLERIQRITTSTW